MMNHKKTYLDKVEARMEQIMYRLGQVEDHVVEAGDTKDTMKVIELKVQARMVEDKLVEIEHTPAQRIRQLQANAELMMDKLVEHLNRVETGLKQDSI